MIQPINFNKLKVVSAIYLLSCAANSCTLSTTSKNKPTVVDYFETTTNRFEVPFSLELQFTPMEESLLAQKSGQIEQIVREGRISANKLLLQYKNKIAFNKLKDKKNRLKTHLNNVLFALPIQIVSVKDKWLRFYSDLSGDHLLPVLPQFEYKEEFEYFQQSGIIAEMNQIITDEKAMKSSFQFVFQSGKITKVWGKKGEFIRKGDPIADWITGHQVSIRFSDTIFQHLFHLNDTLKVNKNTFIIGIQTAGNTYNAVAQNPVFNQETHTLLNAKKKMLCTSVPKILFQQNTLYTIQNKRITTLKPLIIGKDPWHYFVLSDTKLKLVLPKKAQRVGSSLVQLGKMNRL